MIHAGLLTVMYLQSVQPDFGGKVYVIGQGGIPKELEEVGIPYITDEIDTLPQDWVRDNSNVQSLVKSLDPDVRCVMVGFDPNMSYPKIFKAMNYLKREDCPFLVRVEPENFEHLFYFKMLFSCLRLQMWILHFL